VRRRLAASRAQAVDLIEAGRVHVGGAVAEKASRLVSSGEPIVIPGPRSRFVGRGGEKLDAALSQFAIVPEGRLCLDAGASTGGFTDCLLQHGAALVCAVDVGRGQMHERLRNHPRVAVHERTDIRSVTVADLGGVPFDLVVADLSFISLRTVAGSLVALAKAGGDIVVLIKPQFEAGRREASRGKGVIRDPAVWRNAVVGAIAAFDAAGAAMMGIMVSPLRGADGNVEFLVHLRSRSGATTPRLGRAPDVEQVLAEAAGEQEG
jgi:23S rRNA (cytidine1920-2'-O)/16S rRNA (cytidine1409-2'-O)-methyltransferase